MPKLQRSKYARMSPADVDQVVAMRNKGATYKEIAAVIGRPYGTIHRHVLLNLDRITYRYERDKPQGGINEAMRIMGDDERAALLASVPHGATIAETLVETWLDVYFAQKGKDCENDGRTKQPDRHCTQAGE